MVAVLRQIASPVGELFNEVPDRVSDAATLIGFGYAAGSNALLGFVATCFALFLPYLRAMGKVVGAQQEFCGPMAKQQRMAMITIVAIVCALIPRAIDWKIPAYALWLIIAGCIVTGVRRLHRITATLQPR
jgi:phosphatidylglycerophosphate synthase